MLPLLLALAAQDAYPAERFGAYVATVEGLRGPVDALALADGAWLVVERDADRLTRIAPDGARARFGPADLDAPEDVCALPASRGGGFAVADTGNDRVVLLDAEGAVTGAIGGRGDGPGELRAPAGVGAFAGDLYVADTLNGRVQAFELGSRELLHTFGDLVRPVAVELAPDGSVFVVDAGAHQVVVFGDIQPRDEPLGNFGERLRAFGDFGPHAGFLGHPRDLALDSAGGGRVYVADADNHRVQVFDLQGRYVYEWGKHALRPRAGEGSLHYPSGVALVPGSDAGDGARVLVCEAFGDRIQVFGRTDEDPARFMTEPGLIPWKVAPHYGPALSTAGDLLAIFEPETQTVLVHDLELDVPVEVTRFGAYGDAPGQHLEIVDLLVEAPDTAGSNLGGWRVLIADQGPKAKISRWLLDHEPEAPLKMNPRMASFAGSDGDGGPIARAWRGALAVANPRSGHVSVPASPGYDIGSGGTFDEPVDLEFDGKFLWVVDRGARAVVALADCFDAEQRALGLERHRLAGFQRPRGVAVAADGEVYVTDELAHVVRVFGRDESGAFVERRSFGGEGLGPGQLYRPAGIAIDARDRVIVLDHGNHRGMIFDRAGGFLRAFGPRGYVRPTER
jgi:DNA-binding beta-propeller fold protein YncE